jgi:hypothetical protein
MQEITSVEVLIGSNNEMFEKVVAFSSPTLARPPQFRIKLGTDRRDIAAW